MSMPQDGISVATINQSSIPYLALVLYRANSLSRTATVSRTPQAIVIWSTCSPFGLNPMMMDLAGKVYMWILAGIVYDELYMNDIFD